MTPYEMMLSESQERMLLVAEKGREQEIFDVFTKWGLDATIVGTVIPEPRRDKAHRDAWTLWRRRHQYRARHAHQRWHAYADEVPQP